MLASETPLYVSVPLAVETGLGELSGVITESVHVVITISAFLLLLTIRKSENKYRSGLFAVKCKTISFRNSPFRSNIARPIHFRYENWAFPF